MQMLCLCLVALLFFDDPPWKTKRAADWTDAETKQILTSSPWAAMTTPTIKRETQRQPMTHGGGVNVQGVPGLGRRRNSQQTQDETSSSSDSAQPMNIRWESALPIREAELKARETTAPDVDENHYAIAVYGLPTRLAKPDAQALGDHLKGQGNLKREGQKEVKPSSVQVIQRDDGLVIVFLFPRTREITTKDSRVEFNAQIGPYQITQSFHLDEMVYQGKTEL
jgi:hypothetical protein